jgi:hypothetical protein
MATRLDFLNSAAAAALTFPEDLQTSQAAEPVPLQ